MFQSLCDTNNRFDAHETDTSREIFLRIESREVSKHEALRKRNKAMNESERERDKKRKMLVEN